MANADQTQMTTQDRILSAIQQLVDAAAVATHRICDFVTFDNDDVQVSAPKKFNSNKMLTYTQKILKSSLRLLSSTEYLKTIAAQEILDYSAVLFMANMLNDIFSEPSTGFSDVVVSIKQLTGLVSPSTGLGLLEIWAALSRAPTATQDRVLQLQRAAHSLPLERRELRSQILQLLALLTLPGDRSSEENENMQSVLRKVEEVCISLISMDIALMRLTKQMQGNSEESIAKQEYSEDPLLLINELRLLAACSPDSPVSNVSSI
ncbi:hypothetical protein EIP86_006503 [Pleurotus ostreatoroseus]|nr:hypothetical protein EIP86_006503 [Pleurotus ostreatoroseus]